MKIWTRWVILVLGLIISVTILYNNIYVKNAFVYVLNIQRRVIVGKDSWLFYDDGLKSVICPPKKINISNIVHTANFLKSHDLRLLVVPIPDKEMFYNNKIVHSEPDESSVFANYLRFIRKLKENQVDVCNVYEVLNKGNSSGKVLYFKNDSHWNSEAIVVVSDAVVNQFLKNNIDTNCQNYKLVDTTGTFYPDLLKLLKGQEIPETYHGKKLLENTIPCNTADSGIVVFGDSFVEACTSINGRFGEIMSYKLQKPVKTVYKLGAGYKGYKYLNNYRKVCGPETKLIIWVFVFRSQLNRPD